MTRSGCRYAAFLEAQAQHGAGSLVIQITFRVLLMLWTFDWLSPGQISSLPPPAPQTFLYAASRGDNGRLRSFLEQGFDPDSADYGRLEGDLQN